VTRRKLEGSSNEERQRPNRVGNSLLSFSLSDESKQSRPSRRDGISDTLEALAAALSPVASPTGAWQGVGPGHKIAAGRSEAHRRAGEALRTGLLAPVMQMPVTTDRLQDATVAESSEDSQRGRVMIAGGGIGGLCAGLVLKNEGFDVQIFEKTKQYRPFGGPIQIASNALECLRRIDEDVYQEILESATVIGDRVNGLKDGISGEWFATFDLLKPAQMKDMDPSVVIDRPVLQDILLSRIIDRVHTGSEVVGYEQKPNNGGITGFLSDGSQYEADFLIGSDGIKSKVRQTFYNKPTDDPVWSGYTCFAAIAKCVPKDIKTVGYKVFLGPRKYFVSVDVGGGRIQWYAFLNIPPNSLDISPSEALKWLKEEQFNGWDEEVHQLLDCTPDDQVEQRDLYDRPPELKWAEGNVCLLGDAAHPMMPNLGQGGGMAIEDALVLGQELKRMTSSTDVPGVLKSYSNQRAPRAASVQGMSRFSSAILFQYHHPLQVDSLLPPKFRNVGPRSLITRACQGFLQHVAFPLQFDFLFSFPGNAVDPDAWLSFLGSEYEPERQVLEGNMSVAEWIDGYMKVGKRPEQPLPPPRVIPGSATEI